MTEAKWTTKYAASSIARWVRRRDSEAEALLETFDAASEYNKEIKAVALASYELLDDDEDNDRLYFDNYIPRLDDGDAAVCRNLKLLAIDRNNFSIPDPELDAQVIDIDAAYGRAFGEILKEVYKRHEEEIDDILDNQ